MPKPVRLEDEAFDDLDAGIAWYESQRAGLGERFLGAVREAVEVARGNPQRWGLVPGVPARLQARRVMVKRFPYAVVYVDEPDEVRVVAIAHFKRRPGYWVER